MGTEMVGTSKAMAAVGAVGDVYDFVLLHKDWDELAEVEFIWEGDCVAHVED